MLIEVPTDRGPVWVNPAHVLRVADIADTDYCDLTQIIGDSLTVTLTAKRLAMLINDGKAGK